LALSDDIQLRGGVSARDSSDTRDHRGE